MLTCVASLSKTKMLGEQPVMEWKTSANFFYHFIDFPPPTLFLDFLFSLGSFDTHKKEEKREMKNNVEFFTICDLFRMLFSAAQLLSGE